MSHQTNFLGLLHLGKSLLIAWQFFDYSHFFSWRLGQADCVCRRDLLIHGWKCPVCPCFLHKAMFFIHLFMLRDDHTWMLPLNKLECGGFHRLLSWMPILLLLASSLFQTCQFKLDNLLLLFNRLQQSMRVPATVLIRWPPAAAPIERLEPVLEGRRGRKLILVVIHVLQLVQVLLCELTVRVTVLLRR